MTRCAADADRALGTRRSWVRRGGQGEGGQRLPRPYLGPLRCTRSWSTEASLSCGLMGAKFVLAGGDALSSMACSTSMDRAEFE